MINQSFHQRLASRIKSREKEGRLKELQIDRIQTDKEVQKLQRGPAFARKVHLIRYLIRTCYVAESSPTEVILVFPQIKIFSLGVSSS